MFITQGIFLLNTISNPLDDLIEALISLLSLFDIQEKVQKQLNMTTVDGVADETLISMDALLEKVIHNSCDYVSMPVPTAKLIIHTLDIIMCPRRGL